MIFPNIMFLVIGLAMLISAIKVIKKKRYVDLVAILLLIPFLLFLFISINLGGSAFNDAQTDFEYYQAGHYYLESHGKYTEVTHFQFQLAKIAEIVGIVSFIANFLWLAFRLFIIVDD